MKRILVILHIYYHDQVDYFIDKLKNINGCEWKLIVTYSTPDEATFRKIKTLRPDAILMPAENVGYDVWPFIKVIKSIDIQEYDYIMKLHTKNTSVAKHRINGITLRGATWRNILVDSILKSRKHFLKCLEILNNDPQIGMLCSYELLKGTSVRLPEDNILLQREARRIGLNAECKMFCAGTMFIVKPSCLNTIKKAQLDHYSWGTETRSHSKATLAHVYERIFGSVVSESGMKIKGITPYPLNSLRTSIHKSLSPALKSIITIDRYAIDGKKRLTVFGKKFPLE